jgi:F-type H+-transporting ATPase subunit delta
MDLDKKTRRFARSLFKLSLEDGRVSESRVSEILAWVGQQRPRQATALLREYLRLITTEINRGIARVEHAGDLSPDSLRQISASFSQRYGRPIEATSTINPDLIAGLKIRIGCDVYENSIASQLAALESTNL